MTCVHLVRSRTGQLLYCRAEGHSGYAAKGQDIVCAAVTVLLRTVVDVLSKTDGVQLNADFTTRGLVEFAVNKTGFSKKLDAELEFGSEKPNTLPPSLIIAASKLNLVLVLGS